MATDEKKIISYLEDRIMEELKPIVRDMVREEVETYQVMRLSEKSFAELWDNEEDSIWDEY
ncbi:MAG: hypothetical protein GXO65_06725 [Euryarchaeota archaeon]|nr:hypothetical protein [Euryarchaeota archaeon]